MSLSSFSFLISENTTLRLDQFLYHVMSEQAFPREKIKKMIVAGYCFIDGMCCITPSKRLKKGMHIVLDIPSLLPPHTNFSVKNDKESLEILYCDEHIAVLNKPPGLVVHPASSCSDKTLVDILLKFFPQIALQEGPRPGIVHRLDKDTSGLLCVALTEEARLSLSKAFSDRTVGKEYLAIVHGVPDVKGIIHAPLGRHPRVKVKVAVTPKGKFAHTEWHVLYAGENKRYALLAVKIYTGRTHQIRVHMNHIGHPIVGDQVYGETVLYDLYCSYPDRQMLHAWKLDFAHPVSGEPLHFLCPPPKDFFDTACSLNTMTKCLVITGLAGSGKSTVLEIFAQLQFPTWSADHVVEELYSPGGEIWKIFRERYGDFFISHKESPIDKKKLMDVLTGKCDISLDIHELSALVHPFVFHSMIQFLDKSIQEGHAYSIAEVPLWFESFSILSRLAKDDVRFARLKQSPVIGVYCPEYLRKDRLKIKSSWSIGSQEHIDTWQFSQEKKMDQCSYVIDNSGTKEFLRLEVQNIMVSLANDEAIDQASFQHFWNKLVTS